jgi:lipopolysaccharide export system permease protein
MHKVDRLIIKEIFGPWLFGVCIFTVLIWASTFLFKFTDYMVSGVDMWSVVQLSVLSLPAIMVKTFSMATLLSGLLSFGRLSSDSEIVALRAAGASIGRIMRPVAAFCGAVALLAFWFGEAVVPTASRQMVSLLAEIAKVAKRGDAGAGSVVVALKDGDKTLMISALKSRPAQDTLENVVITVFDKAMIPTSVLQAHEIVFKGPDDWRIVGNAKIKGSKEPVPGRNKIISLQDNLALEIEGDVWPAQIPQPKLSFEDIIAKNLKELDTFNMADMRERIETLKRTESPDPGQIANLEYGYWNKLSVPLAALVFGLVGAPLGIRNHRTGAASGFWMSVLIIFGYMMLANFMAIYAKGGLLPPYVASFTPLAIGLVFAAVTIHRKN